MYRYLTSKEETMKLKHLLIVSGLLLLSIQSQAAVFIVDRFEDGPDEFAGNGVCAAANFVGARCTLRAAIMEANALAGADSILVPFGTYELTQIGEDDLGSDGDLDITDEVSIANFSDGFVVKGNGSDRLFHVLPGGDLTLVNATLTDGVANSPTTFEGGAIKVEVDGTLNTDQVTFVNNLGNRGGALFNEGSATIANSYFRHNAITDANTPVNLSSVGSAIFNYSVLVLDSSTLAFNGQMVSVPGNVILSSGQYAIHSNPDGINAPPPLNFVYNTTISNNNYGGIRADRAFIDVNHASIAYHSNRGIRFSRNDNHDDVLQIRIQKSLIARNGFQDCNDLWALPASETDLEDNFNGSTDQSCGFTGTDDLEHMSDPFNGSLHNWGGPTPTLMLKHYSQAVDFVAGPCAPEDQRGVSRPQDGNQDMLALCDIGAVELDPQNDPTSSDVIFRNGFEPQV